MGTPQFDDLAAKLRDAAEVVNAYQAESVQLRVIDALIEAFHGRSSGARPATHPEADTKEQPAPQGGSSDERPARSRSRGKAKEEGGRSNAKRRAPRSGMSFVDDINWEPDGKESFAEFVKRAQAKTQNENCLTAVYWLREIAKLDAVTPDTVYTAYRVAKWTIPKDLSNTISQTGSRHLINSSDRANMTVLSLGINRMEKEMLARSVKAEA